MNEPITLTDWRTLAEQRGAEIERLRALLRRARPSVLRLYSLRRDDGNRVLAALSLELLDAIDAALGGGEG